MIGYNLTESYGGFSLEVVVTANTGSMQQGGVTVATHTVELYKDAALVYTDDTVTTDTVEEVVTRGLDAMKAEIDGTDELAQKLLDMGFNVMPTADPVIGFIATPGGPGTGLTTLDWTTEPDWDNAVIDRATFPDFRDVENIHTAPIPDPVDVPGVPEVHYYYRIKGEKAGHADSDWAYADAVAP